jgi:hypothetical protein
LLLLLELLLVGELPQAASSVAVPMRTPSHLIVPMPFNAGLRPIFAPVPLD